MVPSVDCFFGRTFTASFAPEFCGTVGGTLFHLIGFLDGTGRASRPTKLHYPVLEALFESVSLLRQALLASGELEACHAVDRTVSFVVFSSAHTLSANASLEGS